MKTPEEKLWEAITQGMNKEELRQAEIRTMRWFFVKRENRRKLRRIHQSTKESK